MDHVVKKIEICFVSVFFLFLIWLFVKLKDIFAKYIHGAV